MLHRQHQRRALTDEELAWLVTTTEKGPVRLCMAGRDRAALYLTAVGTGFRAGELKSLTPQSFDLDGDPPTVTVEASYSKRRRRDVQPIRRDLAEYLRPILAAKPAGEPVFHVTDNVAETLRKDLADARAMWIKEAKTPDQREEREERDRSDFLKDKDAGGRVADFHSLRHTYVTRVVRSGASVKVAQDLARHSTPTLTLGVYTHLSVHDHAAALAALPCIATAGPRREWARATGTDDAASAAHSAPEARSALSARRRPRTPGPGNSCQEGESKDEDGPGAKSRGQVATCGQLSISVLGGRAGDRTRMRLPSGDFKSPASALPPLARLVVRRELRRFRRPGREGGSGAGRAGREKAACGAARRGASGA